MASYGEIREEHAQIVPSVVFSGAEIHQQQYKPYNQSYEVSVAFNVIDSTSFLSSNYGQDDLNRLWDDGQVPFASFMQSQHVCVYPEESSLSNGGGYSKLQQEPKTLRECLNSNLPPFDRSPPPYHSAMSQQMQQLPVSRATQESMAFELAREKVEQVGQLAVLEAINHVRAACKDLGISSEPVFWTKEQTEAWLVWTLRRYNLLQCVDVSQFQGMNGIELTMLQELDFKKLAPACGELLWSILDIWRTAGTKTEYDAGGYGCPSSTTLAQELPNSGNVCYGLFDCNVNYSQQQLAAYDALYSNHTIGNSVSSASPCSSGNGFDNEAISDDDQCSIADTERTTGGGGSHTHLWQFLKELLNQPRSYGADIRWMNRSEGVFKIENSKRLARYWGARKNRPAMNYDKLSRSIRQYYKKGIMKKTDRSQRLVYQFCPGYAH